MSQWDAVATVTNCLRHNSLAGEALRSGPQAADGEIVRAVLAGDRESYARLVERYRDRYARYAARMLGSADAAEDALQDAFVRAYIIRRFQRRRGSVAAPLGDTAIAPH